ncbi:YHS domain-containing (seleno)protein [uncultured Marinobacter sp.]|uniref:YHS domain-containing (seleno)protein n=1 Tax=uncultured Marinobacter sp. TaxID=187379 RepID=UPI0030DC981A
MIKHNLRLLTAIFTLLVFLPGLLAYAADNETVHDQPALEGYSPVSYHEQGHPEKGSRDHQSTYQGNVYWFTGAAQKDTFDANPAAFAPSFPRSCPYNLTQGRLETIDPTNFKIVDGQLLLFHRSEERDGLRQWEESISSSRITEKELLRRAKGNFLDLKF